MQGHRDIQGFIQSFSGSHRHILGYLAEEVLNQQSNRTLRFLLQTSILDRLCAPLCDAVTGDSGAQALLENLEHANLFLIPLDEETKWYRYHHLFADVLRAKLQQSQSLHLKKCVQIPLALPKLASVQRDHRLWRYRPVDGKRGPLESIALCDTTVDQYFSHPHITHPLVRLLASESPDHHLLFLAQSKPAQEQFVVLRTCKRTRNPQ